MEIEIIFFILVLSFLSFNVLIGRFSSKIVTLIKSLNLPVEIKESSGLFEKLPSSFKKPWFSKSQLDSYLKRENFEEKNEIKKLVFTLKVFEWLSVISFSTFTVLIIKFYYPISF